MLKDLEQIGRIYQVKLAGNGLSENPTYVCKIKHSDDSLEQCLFIWLSENGAVNKVSIPAKIGRNPMSKRFQSWIFLEHNVANYIKDMTKDILKGVLRKEEGMNNDDDFWYALYVQKQ
jgi:hypothetical protein